METEVERLGRADALTTFTHDFFQRRKHLFTEKNGVWFSFDPSPNIYRFFASDVGGTNRELGDFLNKPVLTRKNNFS